ncbi:unnamed protein product [Calypogeia fissa]
MQPQPCGCRLERADQHFNDYSRIVRAVVFMHCSVGDGTKTNSTSRAPVIKEDQITISKQFSSEESDGTGKSPSIPEEIADMQEPE